MANFECKIYKIDEVLEHPNADRLNIVKIKGYSCISNKLEDGTPRYQANDLVVYIPENAVLPEWLLKKLDMWKDDKGTLAGPNGDRVKAIKLRGVYSEGILYPIIQGKLEYMKDGTITECAVNEGEDVAELLGVAKYEPPIPQSMSGEVFSVGDIFYHYDIESITKYPNILKDGEPVRITEKIHGTQLRALFTLDNLGGEPITFNVDNISIFVYVSSKGLGDRGLCFKDNENNKHNIYLRAIHNSITEEGLRYIKGLLEHYKSVTLYGELFGNTQDLHYGIKPNEENKLNIFDVAADRQMIDDYTIDLACEGLNIPRVPVLYKGPYSHDIVKQLTDGKSTYDKNQIREGVVITPLIERENAEIGRVILKSVSEDYKLRKNGTEFN